MSALIPALCIGDASKYSGSTPDLIFTHPYAPLPAFFTGIPAIINLYGDKRLQAEEWVGATLHEIGRWDGNFVYAANVAPKRISLDDLKAETFAPGRGWFPLEFPIRVLKAYGSPGITVWDGFCGRATVGKACQMLGMGYIGMDIDPERINIARKYLAL